VLEMPVRSFYRDHWSTTGKDVPGYDAPDNAVYLPGRNVLLIGVTAVWCALNDVEAIAIGSLDDNPFPDATPAFFEDYGRVLSGALDHPLEVLAPYRSRHKSQIIAAFPDLPLELTLTCMQPILEMGGTPKRPVSNMGGTPKPPLKGRMGEQAGDADNAGGNGVLIHCGDCNKCRERREAFREGGVADRTRYAK
jgi:7-cyano-7-deazaguanine synthase